MNTEIKILEKIKEALKDEYGDDLHIAAVVASPRKGEAYRVFELDDDFTATVIGELELLKHDILSEQNEEAEE